MQKHRQVIKWVYCKYPDVYCSRFSSIFGHSTVYHSLTSCQATGAIRDELGSLSNFNWHVLGWEVREQIASLRADQFINSDTAAKVTARLHRRHSHTPPQHNFSPSSGFSEALQTGQTDFLADNTWSGTPATPSSENKLLAMPKGKERENFTPSPPKTLQSVCVLGFGWHGWVGLLLA